MAESPLVQPLPTAVHGVRRMLVRDAKGAQVEVVEAGATRVARLPQGGVFSPYEVEDGRVVLGPPLARKLAELGPPPVVVLALVGAILRDLATLHGLGGAHGALDIEGLGFDARGRFGVRPCLHVPMRPGTPMEGDVAAIGQIVKALAPTLAEEPGMERAPFWLRGLGVGSDRVGFPDGRAAWQAWQALVGRRRMGAEIGAFFGPAGLSLPPPALTFQVRPVAAGTVRAHVLARDRAAAEARSWVLKELEKHRSERYRALAERVEARAIDEVRALSTREELPAAEPGPVAREMARIAVERAVRAASVPPDALDAAPLAAPDPIPPVEERPPAVEARSSPVEAPASPAVLRIATRSPLDAPTPIAAAPSSEPAPEPTLRTAIGTPSAATLAALAALAERQGGSASTAPATPAEVPTIPPTPPPEATPEADPEAVARRERVDAEARAVAEARAAEVLAEAAAAVRARDAEVARAAEVLAQAAAEVRAEEEERRAAEAAEAARMEEERRAREAAELRERERLASEEAERLARVEEERRAREEVERLAREEAERLAREEAQRKAREEAERREMERLARDEGERLAKLEADRRGREELARREREIAARREREEAARREREEAARREREEAARAVAAALREAELPEPSPPEDWEPRPTEPGIPLEDTEDTGEIAEVRPEPLDDDAPAAGPAPTPAIAPAPAAALPPLTPEGVPNLAASDPLWGGGVGVTGDRSREAEKGPGKWVESGRSSDQLSADLPEGPTRPMSMESPDKSAWPPWAPVVLAVLVLGALIFAFVGMYGA